MPTRTAGAIITRGGESGVQVLLTRRNVEPFKGMWCLPGGHIDPGESARDCVIREIKEETGLDIEPQLLGEFDEVIPEMDIDTIVTMFTAEARGTLQIDEEEVLEARWFDLAEVRSLPLAFFHGDILNAFADRNR